MYCCEALTNLFPKIVLLQINYIVQIYAKLTLYKSSDLRLGWTNYNILSFMSNQQM